MELVVLGLIAIFIALVPRAPVPTAYRRDGVSFCTLDAAMAGVPDGATVTIHPNNRASFKAVACHGGYDVLRYSA